jgi:DNA-binding MarR family transcriptional regulator
MPRLVARTGATLAKRTTFKLDQNIPFLLHRVASRLAGVANERFKEQKINTHVSRVMLVLLTHEEATVGELCEATSIDQSTLSHMLKRLMARQLITKTREDKDNRTVRVALTPKGAKLAANCAEVAGNYELKALGSISPQKAADLRQMLGTIYENFADEV